MKKYWKGFLLLICGTLPFLFIYASRFLPDDNEGIEKALAFLKERSPELPPEVKDLLPPYPGAIGNTVAVLPELPSRFLGLDAFTAQAGLSARGMPVTVQFSVYSQDLAQRSQGKDWNRKRLRLLNEGNFFNADVCPAEIAGVEA